jgi:hypothetical protein
MCKENGGGWKGGNFYLRSRIRNSSDLHWYRYIYFFSFSVIRRETRDGAENGDGEVDREGERDVGWGGGGGGTSGNS